MNGQRQAQAEASAETSTRDRTPLLKVRNVTKIFGGELFRRDQTIALEDFSLTIEESPPTITAIAGESGSGKTTLARLILGFIEPTDGGVYYRGRELRQMDGTTRRTFRREVQAVFQDPYGAYNPFYRVDHIFEIAIRKFRLAESREAARHMMEEALEGVGLRPDEILGKYPHQLSGGQRQRLMVGRAYLLKPRLIIADEPVSMVDASLRAAILEVMMKLKKELGISFLYITHDLSTAFQIGDQIVILYEGSIAEVGDVETIVRDPKHPYTQLLVGSIPIPDPNRKWAGRVELPPEEELGEGEVAIVGCKFSPRCPHTMEICNRRPPPLYRLGSAQEVSCYLYRTDEGEGEEEEEEEEAP